jgi:tripartite-type tricarboxylate transporter receptor subunit TctC
MRVLQGHGLLLLLLVAGFGADRSYAQSYPTKVVRIQTAGVGSGSDFVARLMANELSAFLGQPVVVENRSGGGVPLFTGVAKAAPDGYTLMVTGGALWTTPLLGQAPYDAARDFASITMLIASPNVLIVHTSLPVRSVADLIKLAKVRPGELNYSTGATGSSSHIAGELFKSLAKTDIVRIGYKEQAQQTVDAVSGQVQMTFGQGASYTAQIKAGKLRAIAVGGSRRSVLYPALPTVAETLPGFVSEQVQAFFAPVKTPDTIIRRLNQETLRALEKPEVRAQMLSNGQEASGGTPEQLTDYVRSDMARVGKMIKDGSIKPGAS